MSDGKKEVDEKGFVMSDSDSVADKTVMPKIDFSTFIFSLNSSALVHLGVIKAPGMETNDKNIEIAKQTIDIIGVLEEKTKGNLTNDEENLLKNILHDLRLMYIKEKG